MPVHGIGFQTSMMPLSQREAGLGDSKSNSSIVIESALPLLVMSDLPETIPLVRNGGLASVGP